ncbi:hypothetical protein KI387_018015, partial [Taxus chinensis]
VPDKAFKSEKNGSHGGLMSTREENELFELIQQRGAAEVFFEAPDRDMQTKKREELILISANACEEMEEDVESDGL